MVLPETQRPRTGFCPNRRVAGRITRKIAEVQAEMVGFHSAAMLLPELAQIIAMPPFTWMVCPVT
ncbi:hypothetical protein EN788_71020 [Mesorhizobium sp. M2D.F.Ca.ET.145.01.1.1]|nr:hypothetical protein EN788_71020 [Mesorhizobium sp. M2D.F.Ca.ET.145.01.1.1]